MGKWPIALAVAAATIAGPATAASAAEDQYTPSVPPGYSLAGSTMLTQCTSGEPLISYSVRLARPASGSVDDPGDVEADPFADGAPTMEASLIVASPRRTATVSLGAVAPDQAIRTIAWPASLDPVVEDVRPGEALSATLVVSPEVAPPLRVPFSAEPCAAARASVASLPVTGGTVTGLIGIGVGAAAAVAVGTVLVARRRQHR